MDTIIRAVSIYFFLLLVLRLSGRRTVGEMTSFDLVLLLIISEATQQALIGDDFSLTTAFTLILTMVLLDIAMSLLKQRSQRLERLLDGTPTVIVADGKPLEAVMKRARVDESDVLSSARKAHGLERMEQIRYAVLEADGKISIVPRHPGNELS